METRTEDGRLAAWIFDLPVVELRAGYRAAVYFDPSRRMRAAPAGAWPPGPGGQARPWARRPPTRPWSPTWPPAAPPAGPAPGGARPGSRRSGPRWGPRPPSTATGRRPHPARRGGAP